MVIFHSWHMPRAYVGPTRVMAQMIRTGKYYPSASWAMTAYGRGMHPIKLEAIWKAIQTPE